MKAFILAAGYGQRMQPITDVLPKPLLTVGNIPLIGYAIALLKQHGITDIMVNAHHLAKVLADYLGDGSRFGVAITMSHEAEILGTGGALKEAHQWLDDTFVVINSDILIEHDLTAFIDEHRRRGAMASMLLRDTAVHERALAVIDADATGRVVRLYHEGDVPKGAELPVVSRMFTGVHVLEPTFLEYIPKGVHTPIVGYAYAKALANGERVFASVCAGYWQDAGTPAEFMLANQRALDGRLALSYIDPLAGYAHAPRRDLGHAIRLGEDVQLGDHVNLERPLLIDRHTQLGERSHVGPFVTLGERVTLGKQSNIRHAVVLPGTTLAAGSEIAHAIVANKAILSVPQHEPPAGGVPGAA